MNQQELQQQVVEFERNRNQLVNVSAQKQQMQFQNQTLKNALEELKKTKERKVYKAVGNILILSEVKQVQKELKEQNESLDLRIKTLQKQEDALIEKLNKLKASIEEASKQAQGTETESKEENKEEK